MDPISAAAQNSSSDGIDVSSLSASDRREVEQFVHAQNTQVAINKLVQDLTDTCFKKCVLKSSSFGGSTITGAKLSGAEESCANNCVGMWLESQSHILRALGDAAKANMAGGGGGESMGGEGDKKGWFS